MLADGRKSLLIISDNDASVTQTGDDAQFDVCRNSTSGAYRYDNAFGGGCPAGSALTGSQILAFREVPEPFAAALVLTGLGGMGWLRRRRG